MLNIVKNKVCKNGLISLCIDIFVIIIIIWFFCIKNSSKSDKNTENKIDEIELIQFKSPFLKTTSFVWKDDDKQSVIDGFQNTVCFVLQAILITLDGEISSFYYKGRLATYSYFKFFENHISIHHLLHILAYLS